jgi:hypothetical protein
VLLDEGEGRLENPNPAQNSLKDFGILKLVSSRMMLLSNLHLSSLVVLLVLLQDATVVANRPLKVFVLAGQSNMVGMASIDHLDLLVHRNTTNSSEFRDALWNGTGYRVRDDVFISNEDIHGNLTVARDSGYASPSHFGPELMIGWALGDALDERVLLIKTAWGGRSLAVDFRPPSSGEGNYSNVKPVTYGWEYRIMIQNIVECLDKIAPLYYNDEQQSYELSGFVWFQGWNDMLNWDTVNEYGQNLVNLIRDVRLDLDAPGLPVIIGELGMHGVTPQGTGVDRVLAMRAHEHGVTLLDEFRNNTLFVRTAPYVVSNGTQYNGGYHYFGKYLLEDAMVPLLVESSLTLFCRKG